MNDPKSMMTADYKAGPAVNINMESCGHWNSPRPLVKTLTRMFTSIYLQHKAYLGPAVGTILYRETRGGVKEGQSPDWNINIMNPSLTTREKCSILNVKSI